MLLQDDNLALLIGIIIGVIPIQDLLRMVTWKVP
jgi:hypothetical protein